MIRTYYYNQQLRKFAAGFANIFAGLQVKTGMDACGDIATVEVPIRYGSADRVVAALSANNTQNKQHTAPMMACYMTGLQIAPDRMHGVNQVDRRTHLEQGGVYPDDVKMVVRVVPIPYNMIMELGIYASNTDQLYQILEQILILFDYDLQIQFNDAPFDWTKITKVTLTDLANEENYPLGPDRRVINWTLSFEMPIWLSPPADVRHELIQTINLRIGMTDQLALDEIDSDGNLAPFLDTPLTTTIVAPIAIDLTTGITSTPNLQQQTDEE